MTRTDAERAASARYSANVRAELARRRMTQTELAELAGMDVEALRRRMRSGKWAASWTANELEQVARALGVSTDVLQGRGERT